jgi:hypothetical protein
MARIPGRNRLTEPVQLHCIGGFVLIFFYELARTTGDIDYYAAIPANVNLAEIAGEGSTIARRHKVWLHRVGVTNLPEDYETRLTQMLVGQFKNLTLLAPDPYDYILSKLERNSMKDRDDAVYLFKKLKLNSKSLRERYEKELRPNLSNEVRHDLTLTLWIEIFEGD